jgi:hypothetical protein
MLFVLRKMSAASHFAEQLPTDERIVREVFAALKDQGEI